MAIPEGYIHNFNLLLEAVKNGDVALVECQDKASHKLVYVIVALNRSETEIAFAPLAKLFDGNPYDELNPPDPDGGFSQDT
jgi:hypothetical protein